MKSQICSNVVFYQFDARGVGGNGAVSHCPGLLVKVTVLVVLEGLVVGMVVINGKVVISGMVVFVLLVIA